MTDAVPQVGPSEAIRLLEQGATLLDVREDDEWRAGHAPQAVHAALSRLTADDPSLSSSATLVIVCRSGRRSDQVASALRRLEFDACNLAGGMQAWQSAGHAVVTPDGNPGTVI